MTKVTFSQDSVDHASDFLTQSGSGLSFVGNLSDVSGGLDGGIYRLGGEALGFGGSVVGNVSDDGVLTAEELFSSVAGAGGGWAARYVTTATLGAREP